MLFLAQICRKTNPCALFQVPISLSRAVSLSDAPWGAGAERWAWWEADAAAASWPEGPALPAGTGGTGSSRSTNVAQPCSGFGPRGQGTRRLPRLPKAPMACEQTWELLSDRRGSRWVTPLNPAPAPGSVTGANPAPSEKPACLIPPRAETHPREEN